MPWPVFLGAMREMSVMQSREMIRRITALRIARAAGEDADRALRQIRRQARQE